MMARRGYVLAELVVTLSLGAMIGGLLGSVLLTQLRAARILAARVAAADAIRTTLHVLPTELRLADPRRDFRGFSEDSVSLRLPRIVGVVCGHAAGHTWFRGNGMREPDARKDSILVINRAGEGVFALAAPADDPGPCAVRPGTRIYRVAVPADTSGGSLVLLFEGGTYYLRDRALRFRMGGEGRQPLTEELFQDDESRFQLSGDSVPRSIHVRVTPRLVFGQTPATPAAAGVPFLNGPDRQ